MYIIFFLVSSVFATGWEARSLKESTYGRDNTFCQVGDKRIQIEIRSAASQTESVEKKYGESLFYYREDDQKSEPKLLPLNQEKLNTYRLFEGESPLCSKSQGFAIGPDKVAVLFLKENRPFKDKLALQLFQTKTGGPINAVDTEYMVDKALSTTDGFLFRTHVDRLGLESGKTKIQDINYTYQDRDFSYWMKYSTTGFAVMPSESFQQFQWKDSFQSEAKFLEFSGWNEKEKMFKNSVLYVAVNYKLKKECILLVPEKIKISGLEAGWRCH
jgi:hypothetical protein